MTLILGGVLLAGLLLAWIHIGSAMYHQEDDAARVTSKQQYLEAIAARGLPRDGTAPNVILVLFDDMGYGDLGSYGGRSIQTPQLDRIAVEGLRFTDYYAPAPVCSPSRAGLLTGRYPPRTRIIQVPMTPAGNQGALESIPLYELQRAAGIATRLPLEEITLAEVLSAAGYATGMFGKWHLGTTSPSLPNDRGFDQFAGLLSSNDQLPNPYFEDGEVVESSPVDQTTLTRRYTDAAVAFIKEHRDQPFFLYLPHTFPHQPLHPSAEQRGKSGGGLYGDVIEDLDASIGRLLDTLAEADLDERTLLLVTSDNGPWFQGSAGAHRGRKTDLFDGGFAVPLLARWPGMLPAGEVRSQMSMGIDVFPTVLGLADLPLPTDRVVDGRDLLPAMRDNAPSPHEALYFYWADFLGAVRSGNFKYHLRRPIRVGYGPAPLTLQIPMGPWLFDLEHDPDESYDVTERYPEEAARLASLLEERKQQDLQMERGFVLAR